MSIFSSAGAYRAVLLTSGEMREADRLAVEGGVPSLTLMENAGRAIAEIVCAGREPGKALVLAGPGNNGGDGFVAARYLRKAGWRVSVACLKEVRELKGDAAEMARIWNGSVRRAEPELVAGYDVIVDGLFGTGLKGPLEGGVAAVVEAVNRSGACVVAADIPSGINSDTGSVMGTAVRAGETVTFFRPKPGHKLMPGQGHCGRLHVADIGIPENVLNGIHPTLFHNEPVLWAAHFPRPDWSHHKYDRGAALVLSGGPAATGAPRLAARGALRAGAGLVTVLCPPDAALVHAAHLTAVMLEMYDKPEDLAAIAARRKARSVVAGPALGIGERTRGIVRALLALDMGVVLDADALTSFSGRPEELVDAVTPNTVLTPHDGEFERVFPGLLRKWPNRIDAAREAAKKCGATVLLKGPNTVIAHAGGRHAALTSNAPPALATAGSGDVLSGIVGGLLAQRMDPFMAACAGAWLHGAAAEIFGAGLIAEDLPEVLPAVLTQLEEMYLDAFELG